MKRIMVLISVILTGCVNLEFDALEYDRFISTQELANTAVSMCGTSDILPQLNTLKQHVDHQYLYTKYREPSPQIATATKNLKEMVDTLQSRFQNYTPSVIYCRDKLMNISESAATISIIIGRL